MSNLYLFFLSDLHLGSKHCDLDFFYQWCKEFEKAPDNKAIYCLGDLLEVSTTRIDAYDVNLTTHEALERLIEYGKHGTKTSKNPMLAMNGFVNDMNHIKADLFCCGHNHYSAFYSQYERGYDGGKRASYLFSGHFLNYDGYARNKGLLMSPPSFSRLKVDKKLHILCDTYYSDEVM